MIKKINCIEVTTVLPFRRQEYIYDLITGEWYIVKSTHLTDSVTMMTKEGFELRHEVFFHEPEPEEPEEAVEE